MKRGGHWESMMMHFLVQLVRLGCVCKTYMCEKVILKSSLYPSDKVKYYVMVF